ncbi:hypothetical protein D3C77_363240 [compost metagenome]
MQGKAAIASFQLAGTAASSIGAAIAQLACAMNAVDRRGRNTVIEAVHYPANGVAAVEQGGWTANDFNAFDGCRVQRYGVIVGQR